MKMQLLPFFVGLLLAVLISAKPNPNPNPMPASSNSPAAQALEAIGKQLSSITRALAQAGIIGYGNGGSGTLGGGGGGGNNAGLGGFNLYSIKQLLETLKEIKTVCQQLGCDDHYGSINTIGGVVPNPYITIPASNGGGAVSSYPASGR